LSATQRKVTKEKSPLMLTPLSLRDIKLSNHLLGFTNSQALACSNSVNPFAHPFLLVLLQIISQCGIVRAYELLLGILLIKNVEKKLYYLYA